jgi:adenosylmethionine-8-amino-7-oxononanoate aminotransferase
MLKNDQLDQWDRDFFFHPSTHLAQHARGISPNRIVTGGSGAYIEDRDGRRLLDAFAGLYCVNVGYGRREIADAIAEQAKELAYYHAYVGHGTEASITLAKMVLERSPKNMSKVYFGLGGSDANETNIKLVWYYNNILGRPEKKKIISRWRGYHGSGLMTGSLTGLELFHKKFDLPLDCVIHTEAPYYYRRPDPATSEEAFTAHLAAELEAGREALKAAVFTQCEQFIADVAATPEDALNPEMTFVNSLGEQHALPRGLLIAHVINHATHHRGQISAALTQLGFAAPVMDLPYFLIEWKSHG